MNLVWKTAVMAAAVCAVMGSVIVYAQTQTPPVSLKYEPYQHPMFGPEYEIVRDAMADFYKGTEYEKKVSEGGVNPFIDIAQIDLNGDRMEEIIATPVESDVEIKPLCNDDGTCPFFVLEVRDRTVHRLARIDAHMIDRGSDIVNGYWTLNVYHQKKDGTLNTQVYAYDPAKDVFTAKASPTVAPAPAKP